MEGEESKSITKPLGTLPEGLPEYWDEYPAEAELPGEREEPEFQESVRQFVFNVPGLIAILLLMLAIGFTGGTLLGGFGGYYLAASRGIMARAERIEAQAPLQIMPVPGQDQGGERQFIIPLPLAPGQSGLPPGSVIPPGIAPGQVIPGPGVLPGSSGLAPGASRPYLGVRYDQISPQIAQNLHLSVSEGALVREVEPGSPAARAGLETGDVITAIDDQAVDLNHPLFLELLKHQPGENLTLTVRRGNQDIKKTLTLDAAPAPQPQPSPQRQPRQSLPRS